MSRKTQKWTLRGVAVFLFILIAIPFSIWWSSRQTEAAWWNDLWMYRKSIAVTNASGGVLTDFQVKILNNSDLSADITAGKIQADLDDLRFTDINGNVLPYWIEDATAASVDAWIKVPSLPTSGATVYLYYGNPSAASYADGNRVFEFFDDFNNADFEAGWIQDSGTWSLETFDNKTTAVIEPSASSNYLRFGSYATPSSFVLETKTYSAQSGDAEAHPGLIFNATNGTNDQFYWRAHQQAGGIQYGYYNGALSMIINYDGSYAWTTWLKTTIKVSGDSAEIFQNDISKGTRAGLQYDGVNSNVGLLSHSSGKNYFDYILIRKYASADPSTSSGQEEKGTGPVAYWSFDEGYGNTFQDSTANNLDGTLSGLTRKDENECISGKCVYSSGTNYFTKADDSKLDFGTESFTVSFWGKPIDYTYPKGFFPMNKGATAYSNGNPGWCTDSYVASGVYISYNDGTHKVTDLLDFNVGNRPPDLKNKWTHIVYVFDKVDNKIYAYINGVKQTDSINIATVTGSISNASALSIGTGAGWGTHGYMDEFKLYPYARTATQIRMDYNAGLAGTGGQEGASVSMGGKSQKWISDGLVGHWKMDEASWNGTAGEIKDASGSNNNGTAAAGATIGAGKFGNGGSFDGTDDYASVPVTGITAATGSVSVWFNRNDFGGSGANYIFAHTTASNSRIYLKFNAASATLYSTWGSVEANVGSYVVSNGQWYHVVLTWEGTAAKMYVNGILNASGSITALADVATSMSIGTWNSDANQVFEGKIDEVKLYNRALKPDEVVDLYNFAPAPVGHWKMDERTGQYAYDTSGNGNAGTLGSSTGVDTNDPVWAQGKVGSGLNFDGSDDYVDAGNASSLQFVRSFTFSAWIKLNGSSGGGTVFSRYKAGSAASATEVNLLAYAGSVSYLYISDGTTLNYDDFNMPASCVNNFCHIAALWDKMNNIIKIYINGSLIDSTASTISSLQTTGKKFGIGSEVEAPRYYFNGLIDDAKIYNYARTADQIKEDMLARGGSALTDKSAVGYWKFDEGQGGTANNSGSGGSVANGTITGATWSNDGKFGKALSFDGTLTKYVQVPAISYLTTGAPFTISTWVKPQATGNYRTIVGYDGLHRLLIYANGQLLSQQDGNFSSLGVGDVPDDVWTQVIYWNNGTEERWYVNGKQSGTSHATVNAEWSSAFKVGQYDLANYPYKGLIDEVKIYNYALTQEEIDLDYNQGKSIQMGSVGTTATGAPSNAADRGYCPPGDTTATCGPVGEWKFDEGSGQVAKDTSGGGNNGTLGSGATADAADPTYAAGKIGKALKFDGTSDYVDVAYNAVLSPVNVTLGAWFYTNNKDANQQRIVSRTQNGGYQLSLNENNACDTNSLCGLVFVGGAYHNVGYAVSNLVNNRWYYVSSTYDGETLKLYLNGVLVDSNTTPSGNITYANNNSFCIAAEPGNTNCSDGLHWSGYLDEVRIYNYARTPAQIAWDFNRGAPIGWWKMDEGEGASVYDWSGNNNTGALTNMDPATDWVAGKVNKALDFDGADDYVDMGNQSILDITGNLTITAWIRKTSSTAGTIVAKNQSSNYGYWLYASDKLNFYGVNNTLVTSNQVINTGDWMHVAVIRNGTDVYLYINGILDKTSNVGGVVNAVASSQTLKLGRRSDASSWFFDSEMDDVRVYNYALTQEQVEQAYNGGAMTFK